MGNSSSKSSLKKKELHFESVPLSSSLPYQKYDRSKPVQLDTNTFAICLFQVDKHVNVNINSTKTGLYTLKLASDKVYVQKWKVEKESFVSTYCHMNCWPTFMPETNEIYAGNHTITLDFEKKQYKFEKPLMSPIGNPYGSAWAYLKNELHIILGKRSNAHIKFNPLVREKTVDLVHTLYAYDDASGVNDKGIANFGFTHNRHTNCFYIFGGYRPVPGEVFDTIWQYDITKEEWRQLETTLPEPMQDMGCVSVMRGKYILLLDPKYVFRNSHGIWIFDVESEMIIKSKFELPACPGDFISIENEELDKQIVDGYLRRFGKEFNLNLEHLADVISSYYWRGNIYLIGRHAVSRIDTLKIFEGD